MLAERLRQPARQMHAARADTDQRHIVETLVPLDDFMRDARKGSRHAIGVHDYSHGNTCL